MSDQFKENIRHRFSNHLLRCRKNDSVQEFCFARWVLNKAGEVEPLYTDQIRWITCNDTNRMWITGDYSDWVFSRSFHPVQDSAPSLSYMLGKAELCMGRRGTLEFNEALLIEQLEAHARYLVEEEDWTKKRVERDLVHALQHTGSEAEYLSHVRSVIYNEDCVLFSPGGDIPDGMRVKPHLRVILCVYELLFEAQPAVLPWEPVSIAGVAIKTPEEPFIHDETTSEVYSLVAPRRHCDVMEFMLEEGFETPIKGTQGFVLHDGTFVDRVQAKTIAEEAEQLLERASDLPELFSEDIW